MFTEGKLHMGPFTANDGYNNGYSYSLMIDGKPANSHYFTYFNIITNSNSSRY
jgi:hypothetical protein